MIRRIDRYLFKEMFFPFLLGGLILTFLMLFYQLSRLTEWVMDKGVSLFIVADLFLKLLPSFFLFTLPMAAAFAVIIAFNRLTFDNELMALSSLGVGFHRLLPAVLSFSLMAALLTLLMGSLSHPWGAVSIKSVSNRLLQEKVGIGLNAGHFTEVIPGLMIYTESIPVPTQMRRVFIYDGRLSQYPRVIAAQKGFFVSSKAGEEMSVGIVLKNGILHSDHLQGDNLMTFGSYSLTIQSQSKGGSTPVPSLSGTAPYKKYSLAFAAILFSFVGAPLGMLSGKAGRLGSIAFGILLILLYYTLTIVGDALALKNLTSYGLSAWLPNLVLTPIAFLLVGIYSNQRTDMFWRKRKRS